MKAMKRRKCIRFAIAKCENMKQQILFSLEKIDEKLSPIASKNDRLEFIGLAEFDESKNKRKNEKLQMH